MMARPGVWQGFPTPTPSYQLLRCNSEVVVAADIPDSVCISIDGAITGSRNFSDEDIGKHLVVRITATNSKGSTVGFTASNYAFSTNCDAFLQEICQTVTSTSGAGPLIYGENLPVHKSETVTRGLRQLPRLSRSQETQPT